MLIQRWTSKVDELNVSSTTIRAVRIAVDLGAVVVFLVGLVAMVVLAIIAAPVARPRPPSI